MRYVAPPRPAPRYATSVAPPAPPSIPALVHDVDDGELAALQRDVRKGTGRWMIALALTVTVGVLGSFGLTTSAGAEAKVTKAAAAQQASREQALEEERQLRAARSQGEWVEMNGVPKAPASAAPSASAMPPKAAHPLFPPAKTK